jgi:membrane-associated phospholipid phosphatase
MQKQNFIHYTTFISLLLPILLVQAFVPQMDIVLKINGLHQIGLDYLCLYGTFLGDGWFIVVVCLALFFYKPRIAVLILMAYLLSSGVTQALKHFVFPQFHRPLWHLESNKDIIYHLVPGTDVSYNFSFPSGHTTSAFAFFGILYFFAQNKLYRQLWMVLAFFTGFTRIYLLQHFLIDTSVGAFIGFTTAFLIHTFWYQTGKLDFLLNKLKA